jgi:hypothetical protein
MRTGPFYGAGGGCDALANVAAAADNRRSVLTLGEREDGSLEPSDTIRTLIAAGGVTGHFTSSDNTWIPTANSDGTTLQITYAP